MNISSIMVRRLKQLIPPPVKRAVREARLQWKLSRAVRRIANLSPGDIPTAQMLLDLQAGWGNDGYAARTDYLEEVARRASATLGPILECGSGLTTLLLGLLAGRRGVKTYSLEHISEWRARVNKALVRFQIPRVRVYSAPLREYEGFAWYDPPLAEFPENFELVICDGPPGDTRGGRYGLLDVLGERLLPGSVILLDDTERAGEAEVLRRWTREADVSIDERENSSGSFAVITRIERGTIAGAPYSAPDFEQPERRPLISVIIPAYNVAPFIGETLRSVFVQTFTDFEVIVINDGSPDTEEFERVLDPFRERIRYLKQENRGASAARNAGLRAARGEFVAFLDADDLWLPSYVEDQLEVIRVRNCDLVCADALVVGESPDAGRTYFEAVMDTAPPNEVTFLDLLSGERSLITSGVLVRRDLIMEVGLFDETLRNAQDFDLWLRLARHGTRLAYQPRVLLKYRARLNSLTGDAINSHLRELLIFEKVEQSYGLTPEERAEVEPVIRNRRALVQYELGKLYLLPGDFTRARAAFAKSNSLRPSLKTRGALWFARLAPTLMRALYARRTMNQLQPRPNGAVAPGNGNHAATRFQEQT